MSKQRRQHRPELKAQVGLEALKGIEPVHVIAARHKIHPVQVSQWKKEVAGRLPELFARKADGDLEAMKAREKELFEEIGRLKMDLEWLKKKLRRWSVEERRRMIEPAHRELSLSHQCRLLGLARASYYHRLKPESAENLALMKAIDKAHTDQPFFGARQLVRFRGDEGWVVNRKRIRRLMILMGLEAMGPQPDLSKPNRAHAVYPYLLKGLAITHPNQVWSTDITFVPIVGGFAYLCAVIDWYSRMVLAWTLSNTIDVGFCSATLQAALRQHGAPEIFNSDQGSQFTSPEFTQILIDREIRISMDGVGRCLDNVFVERLWRSVKYEEIYIFGYDSIPIGQRRLAAYFKFYNHRRPHSSLDGRKPAEAYASPLPLAV